MKKLITSAILSVLIATSSFATEKDKVNHFATANFSQEFKYVKNVTWTSTENYVKASFVLNDKRMEALYDHEGNKIATCSAISIDDLPTNAKRVFAKKYADYTVNEAIQAEGADETSYYISAETNEQSLLLKVSSGGQVLVLKNDKK